MKKLLIILLALLAMMIVGCTADEGGESTEDAGAVDGEPTEILLMTHDSFDIGEETITFFEEQNNADVVLIPSGDAGAALNQAILAKENPIADVFFGVDNTFLGRALEAEIFVPYESPLLAEIPDALELDESHHLLPVDYGDVCINYDKQWFEEAAIPVPQNLADLTDPQYEGLLVVENPATSSPGLAFLLATIAAFGEGGDYDYLDFWADLRENDVLVTDGWENAYYGQFTVASDGNRPLVVSYASSPPAEVIFAEEPPAEAPSASITGDGSCFRQIEFIGILQGTQKEELARALVDFMLDERFQADIPLHMFVFPANENVPLPDPFVEHAQIPDNPAFIEPEIIDRQREEWIQAWTEVVLR